MLYYRVLGFVISMVALVLALVWFGWKFTLVVWLAMWANNLSMAARFGYKAEPAFPTVTESEEEELV